jgi:hypothetical protein
MLVFFCGLRASHARVFQKTPSAKHGSTDAVGEFVLTLAQRTIVGIYQLLVVLLCDVFIYNIINSDVYHGCLLCGIAML